MLAPRRMAPARPVRPAPDKRPRSDTRVSASIAKRALLRDLIMWHLCWHHASHIGRECSRTGSTLDELGAPSRSVIIMVLLHLTAFTHAPCVTSRSPAFGQGPTRPPLAPGPPKPFEAPSGPRAPGGWVGFCSPPVVVI